MSSPTPEQVVEPLPHDLTGRVIGYLACIWLTVSAAMVAVVALTIVIGGTAGFLHMFQSEPLPEIPYRIRSVSWLSALCAWLLTGIGLALASFDRIRRRWGMEIACVVTVACSHLIALHGRHFYGDVWDYYLAAVRLMAGEALPPRYIYPPFWATMLAPLTPAGGEVFAAVLWLSNIGALAVFQVLLARLLQRYAFPRRLACLLAAGFLLVNVPLERTLGYVQVNLHVVNLVYGSLLLYPAHPVWSALCLATAVHIKGSPVLFIILFLYCRDWRWLGWFGAFAIGLTIPTLVAFGAGPFAQFLHNAINIYQANGIKFNDFSVDSLVRATLALAGSEPRHALPFIYGLKLAVLGLLFNAGRRATRNQTFVSDDPATPVLNGVPFVLLATVLLSPLVWEHHSLLLALAYLLPLRTIRTPWEIAAWCAAVFVQFALPVVAFYPWSYGRLVAHGVIFILCVRLPDGAVPGPLFSKIAHATDGTPSRRLG